MQFSLRDAWIRSFFQELIRSQTEWIKHSTKVFPSSVIAMRSSEMTLEKEPRSVPSLLIAAEIGCRASNKGQGSTGTAQEPIVRGSPFEYRNPLRVTGKGAYRVFARVTSATHPMLLPHSFIHSSIHS